MRSDLQDADERFMRLVYLHLDGAADVAERDELAALLHADPTRMVDFVALSRVDGWLHDALEPAAQADRVDVPRPRPVAIRSVSRRWSRRGHRTGPAAWCAAAAALVAAILTVVMVTGRGATPSIARLESTTVALVERGGRSVSESDLQVGDRLTALATAAVVLRDGSRIVMTPGSRGVAVSASRFDLDLGEVQVEAVPRNAGEALAVVTPLAEARVLGTAFTVRTVAGSTRLDVEHGLVRFIRRHDGTIVDVPAHAWAEVAAGKPFLVQRTGDFVCGVNLNGGEEVIAGERWWSHGEAAQRGLVLPVGLELAATTVVPVPAVDAATARMLNTAVYRAGPMQVTMPLASGRYQVELWMMENYAAGWRSLEIDLEGGRVVVESMRADRMGAWHRLVYPVEVRDGRLDIGITPTRGDAHLMGFCIRRR